MLMYLNEIADKMGVSTHCCRNYLCRADFAPCRTSRQYIFNMDIEHLELLKNLIFSRQGNSRRRKSCVVLQDE